MFAVHGCNVTQFKERSGYPHCESYNMTDIEVQYCNSPLKEGGAGSCTRSPDWDGRAWQVPGDCAYIDRLMAAEEIGFNGGKFQGCDLKDGQVFV